jgi:hypothetical protein
LLTNKNPVSNKNETGGYRLILAPQGKLLSYEQISHQDWTFTRNQYHHNLPSESTPKLSSFRLKRSPESHLYGVVDKKDHWVISPRWINDPHWEAIAGNPKTNDFIWFKHTDEFWGIMNMNGRTLLAPTCSSFQETAYNLYKCEIPYTFKGIRLTSKEVTEREG